MIQAYEQIATSPTTNGAVPYPVSAVSWAAIVAGAAGAAALSLILVILGVGLGLSTVSPWAYDGMSATSFGISTILWVTLTQLLASGMGGYLAGRLRTKWIDAHADEVYFRDTAHGFLAWAIASLATAALLTSVVSSIIGGGVKAGATIAGSATTAAVSATAGAVATTDSERTQSGSDNGSLNYFVDSLFRPSMPNASVTTATGKNTTTGTVVDKSAAPSLTEVSRIFLNAGRADTLPPDDVRYVGQLVARHTGLSQQEAEQRVTDTYARVQAKLKATEAAVKNAADHARKASAYAALWLFISLLVGAFVASVAATFGGRQRDL